MLNRVLIMTLAPADSWLRRYTLTSPARVPFHHREAMLDELDTLIARQRRFHRMDNVHALLDTAHWVSKWPIETTSTTPTFLGDTSHA